MKLFFYYLLLVVCFYLPLTASADQQLELTSNKFKDALYGLSQPVSAKPYWYFQTSVWTSHFNPKPEHNNRQKLLAIERNRDDSYIWGGATFLNSFEQRSVYAYVGKRFDFAQTPFYSKVTGGFLHGYRGEYRDKIPFNRLEIALVILPSLGVKVKNFQTDIILLGANAVIMTIGVGI